MARQVDWTGRARAQTRTRSRRGLDYESQGGELPTFRGHAPRFSFGLRGFQDREDCGSFCDRREHGRRVVEWEASFERGPPAAVGSNAVATLQAEKHCCGASNRKKYSRDRSDSLCPTEPTSAGRQRPDTHERHAVHRNDGWLHRSICNRREGLEVGAERDGRMVCSAIR